MKIHAKVYALLFVITLLLTGCDYRGSWQYEPGVILGAGNEGRALSNRNGDVFTLIGYRRIRKAKLEPVSAYHLLLLEDDTTQYSGGGSDISMDKAITTVKLYALSNQEVVRSLEFIYDGKSKILKIGDQEFSTEDKNMFIVRVDKDWKPSTEQLNGKLEERADPASVLMKFKEIARSPEIQNLELVK
jgi:hypothetical protein